MNKLDLPLYSHDNGTFIMIGVFSLSNYRFSWSRPLNDGK
jgi:hypothetical protein